MADVKSTPFREINIKILKIYTNYENKIISRAKKPNQL